MATNNNPAGGAPYHTPIDDRGGKVSVPWLQWFNKLQISLTTFGWGYLNFIGSNLTDIQTRNHNDLQSMQGGSPTTQYYHITSAQFAMLTSGTAHQVLHGNATTPTWGAVDLTAEVSGTLPVGNGGTGNASWTAGQILYASGTTTLTQSANLSYDGVNTLTVPSTLKSLSGLALNAASGVSGSNVLINSGTGSVSGGGIFSLSAGDGNTAGGPFQLTSGSASGVSGSGGYFNLASGNGSATSGVGGDFNMAAGSGPGTGPSTYGGGVFYINGGAATNNQAYGGDVIIKGGAATLAGNQGGVRLVAGDGTVLAYFGQDAGTGASGIGLWGKAAAFNTAPQRTYGAVTGALSRAAFNTGTVTLVDLAAIVGQLIEDLRARGDIA